MDKKIAYIRNLIPQNREQFIKIINLLFISLLIIIIFSITFKLFIFTPVKVEISMRASASLAIGQIFFDTGKGYSEIESAIFHLDEPSETYNISVPGNIKAIRFDPLMSSGNFQINSVTFKTLQKEYIYAGNELYKILVPSDQIKIFSDRKDCFAGMSTGKDPFMFIKVPHMDNKIPLLQRLIIFLLLLFIMTVIFLYSRKGYDRIIPCLMFFICGLMCSMAIVSAYNSHPDEDLHCAAARYYFNHILPPPIGDPEIRDSYSSIYGFSYLQELDIVYLMAGKFVSLFSFLGLEPYIALRFFNIFLFLILTLYCCYVREKRIVFICLLISPQVWYVFSYFNGDAFPFFLSIIIVNELLSEHSFFNKSLKKNYIAGVVFFGILIGLLSISKRNYYIFILFIFVYLFYRIKLLFKENRTYIIKYIFLMLIAFSIFFIRSLCDVYINGFDKSAKILSYKEYLTGTERNKSYPNLNLRQKGVTYIELFTLKEWHRYSFNSFVGTFSYWTVKSIPEYYTLIFYIYMLFLCFIITSLMVKGKLEDKFFLIFIILFTVGTIFLSTYYCWTYDFQPQGRHLFSIFGMFALLFYINRENLDEHVITFYSLTMFILSISFFIFTGLFNIPKIH